MEKAIHWELCRKLKFDHTTKWYLQKPESTLENETLKILWDFEIQTDHLLLARRPNLMIINKKGKPDLYSSVPADNRMKFKENEKRDEFSDLVRELKIIWSIRLTVIPFIIEHLKGSSTA